MLTTRRRVLKALAAAGAGTVVFHRAVAALAQESTHVSSEMIREAEWIAGVELTDEQRQQTAGTVDRALRDYEALRAVRLGNSVPPAVSFHPAPSLPRNADQRRGAAAISESAPPSRPDSPEALAYLPVVELAPLIRSRHVTSTELTQLYLDRLRRYDPLLKCVVSLTEELALRQAEQADREIAAGRYRGPLHGIPWGAKDLIAYPGYKTTWGATPFKDQQLDVKATVAKRLEVAGAVLVAKLSLGALAMGDLWFGGRTRNPWNPQEGSSGSSAGSAAATAAGLVAFAIGSETHGSIVSPCRRCGATGLRPTFGRVSRHGCMTLAWSLDKLGPIARCVEDCALVFDAIHGWDGFDLSAVDQPFTWPCTRGLRSLKVGYVESETRTVARPELEVLRGLGVNLVPIELPQEYPSKMLQTILNTEAAAAFDELTRSGVTEGLNSWPQTFRSAQFVPAVEYLRAQRVRTLMMRGMEDVMSRVDLYVGGDDMTLTNLTGHPTVVLPNGLRKRDDVEVPTAITFTGRLYGESELLAVAHAYQLATGYHLQKPPLGGVE
jgi:Asp-tRNA(Asn)/Glu-tRNA(Gln) amidotransferase A subunit family amidase